MTDVLKFGSAAMLGGQNIGQSGIFGMGETTIIARVVFILLDDSDKEKFDKYGGWKGIGTIECVPYINGADQSAIIPAKPIDSHFTKWPVINELVSLKRGVSFKSQGGINNYSPEWYYSEIISTWNATEHNATPDTLFLKTRANKTPYSETTTGLTSIDNTNQNLDITGDFKDTGKVRKIIKAPGDMTIEGRSGNTIRIGSYIENFISPISGADRSPLIMIVNGQRETTSKVPIFEDVNKDGSSFYLLQGQAVNFIASSVNFDSFNMTIDTTVKSNYVEPVITTNVPVSQSANNFDDKLITAKGTDKAPETLPVSNMNKPKETTNIEDDEVELPTKESNTQYAQETEDIINLDESSNDDKTYKPDDKDVVMNISSASLLFNVPFEVQQNRIYCFVAAATMLLRYLGVNTSQNGIGSKYVDSSNNLDFQKVANDAKKKLTRIAIPGGQSGYDYIINKIKSLNKPFILQRKGISAANHFVVVIGLSSDGKIIVNDPRSTGGRNNILKVSDLKDSGGSLRILN